MLINQFPHHNYQLNEWRLKYIEGRVERKYIAIN